MFFLTHSFDQVTPPRQWPHYCSPYQVQTPRSRLQRPPPVFPAFISSLTSLYSSSQEILHSVLSFTGPQPSSILSHTSKQAQIAFHNLFLPFRWNLKIKLVRLDDQLLLFPCFYFEIWWHVLCTKEIGTRTPITNFSSILVIHVQSIRPIWGMTQNKKQSICITFKYRKKRHSITFYDCWL